MPATRSGLPAVRRSERSRPAARFEVRCGGCGYGGVVSRFPARCPMCGGSAWHETGSRRDGAWGS